MVVEIHQALEMAKAEAVGNHLPAIPMMTMIMMTAMTMGMTTEGQKEEEQEGQEEEKEEPQEEKEWISFRLSELFIIQLLNILIHIIIIGKGTSNPQEAQQDLG